MQPSQHTINAGWTVPLGGLHYILTVSNVADVMMMFPINRNLYLPLFWLAGYRAGAYINAICLTDSQPIRSFSTLCISQFVASKLQMSAILHKDNHMTDLWKIALCRWSETSENTYLRRLRGIGHISGTVDVRVIFTIRSDFAWPIYKC